MLLGSIKVKVVQLEYTVRRAWVQDRGQVMQSPVSHGQARGYYKQNRKQLEGFKIGSDVTYVFSKRPPPGCGVEEWIVAGSAVGVGGAMAMGWLWQKWREGGV